MLQLQTCLASHPKSNSPADIVSGRFGLLDTSDMIHWSGDVATNAQPMSTGTRSQSNLNVLQLLRYALVG